MSSRLPQFSDSFEHSTPFVPPQTCLLLCLNLELPAQQEKKVEAATAVLRWSQIAVVLLGGHMQGVLASMIVSDDPPIGVIGVAIRSICRWLILTQDMGMLLH